jgi:hypothetical protein
MNDDVEPFDAVCEILLKNCKTLTKLKRSPNFKENLKTTIAQLDRMTPEEIVDKMKDCSPRSFNQAMEAKKNIEQIKSLIRVDSDFRYKFHPWQLGLLKRIDNWSPTHDERKIIFLCDVLTEGGIGFTSFCQWLGSLPINTRSLPNVNNNNNTSPATTEEIFTEEDSMVGQNNKTIPQQPKKAVYTQTKKFHHLCIDDESSKLEDYFSSITFEVNCATNIFLVDVPRSMSDILPYSLLQKLKDGKWKNSLLFEQASLSTKEQPSNNIVIVCMHSLPDFTKLSNDQFELHCIENGSLSLKPLSLKDGGVTF